jgi:hypothetical protein
MVRVIEEGPHGFGEGAVGEFMRGLRETQPEEYRELTAPIEPADISPLEFFLQVMRDPKAPAGIRFKAVKLAARYTHRKQLEVKEEKAAKDERPVLDNRWGFEISLEAVLARRAPTPNLTEGLSKEEITAAVVAKANAVWEAIRRRSTLTAEERKREDQEEEDRQYRCVKGVKLPDSYGYDAYLADRQMLFDITAKGRKQRLVPEEEFARAQLLARTDVYIRDRARARVRVESLEDQLDLRPDAQMQAERDRLELRFPAYLAFIGEEGSELWTMHEANRLQSQALREGRRFYNREKYRKEQARGSEPPAGSS